MTVTQQRDRAIRLAPTDHGQALTIARLIPDPWFACQALAWVARFAPDDQVRPIVRESLRTAIKAKDPFRIVVASAWPIRAIIERGQMKLLRPALAELLERVPSIEPAASKSEALFILFQAVFPAGSDMWRPIFDALISGSLPVEHWRQRRNLADAIEIVWNDDKRLASQIISGLDDVKLKQRVVKAIERGRLRSPRPFFWT